MNKYGLVATTLISIDFLLESIIPVSRIECKLKYIPKHAESKIERMVHKRNQEKK